MEAHEIHTINKIQTKGWGMQKIQKKKKFGYH